MRQIAILLIFIFSITCSSALNASSCQTYMNKDEMLSLIADDLGVSKSALELVYNDKPELFNKVDNYALGVKVLNAVLKADDTGAVVEIINSVLGKGADEMLEQICPENFITFIKVVKVYKTFLEGIRDNIFIPKLQEDMYKRYKAARGGVLDYRYANMEEAFNEATARGKYFPVKQKMYDELIKSKGYNKKLLGEKLEKQLWKEIDDFWAMRMEVRYQKEVMKKMRVPLELAMRNKVKNQLMKIKQELTPGPVKLDAALFLKLPADLPDGWWYDRKSQTEKKYLGIPQPQTLSPNITYSMWEQIFYISDKKGYKYVPDTSFYYNETLKKYLKFIIVSIYISPRYVMLEGSNIPFDYFDAMKAGVNNPAIHASWFGRNKNAIWQKVNDIHYMLEIIKKNMYIEVRLSSQTTKTVYNENTFRSLAKYFARKIIANIYQAPYDASLLCGNMKTEQLPSAVKTYQDSLKRAEKMFGKLPTSKLNILITEYNRHIKRIARIQKIKDIALKNSDEIMLGKVEKAERMENKIYSLTIEKIKK